MKLDYLQFLELEIFTRFGARLEASMETAIHRGHILREILKQDRLSPLTAEFQLAWLIAFNDGLFEYIDPDAIPAVLSSLEKTVQHTTLGLESSRDEWSAVVQSCISPHIRNESK